MELTGPPMPLAEGIGITGFGAVDLAVSRAGDLLYVTTNARGSERPMWVARNGTSQLVDPGWDIGPVSMKEFALSPDGRRLAVSIGTRTGGGGGVTGDIWVKELDQGPLSKLTFGGINDSPAWSSDGKMVYYRATATGDPNSLGQLFRIRADGTGTPEPMPTVARGVSWIAVAPRDGWVVVATENYTQGAGDLLAFRPGLDTVMTPLLESLATESAPAISPDGRWLAYASTESGQNEIYVRPFPNVTQGKWQISQDRGFFPRWSHRGTEIFYATATGNLMSVEIRTTPTLTVGQRRILHPSGTFWFFDVAPDDERTLQLWAGAGADSARTRLVLVQNFLAELRARK
jgi:serine/threonine-protein kinase